jgi:serine/threonine-protein kinase
VYVDEKQYTQAVRLFREVLQLYAQTLAADHQLVGIARIRLGRALLRQRRYAEAETESRAGYEILLKQPTPPAAWLQWAQTDLAAEYEALGQPEKAAAFRAELAKAER